MELDHPHSGESRAPAPACLCRGQTDPGRGLCPSRPGCFVTPRLSSGEHRSDLSPLVASRRLGARLGPVGDYGVYTHRRHKWI